MGLFGGCGNNNGNEWIWIIIIIFLIFSCNDNNIFGCGNNCCENNCDRRDDCC